MSEPRAPAGAMHVCLSRSWGGQEMFVLDLARAQRDAGRAVVVAARRGTPLAERSRAAGLEVLAYRPPADRLVFPWRVRRRFGRGDLGVLHAHGLRGLVRASLGLLGSGLPRVLSEHARREGPVRHPGARLALAGLGCVHAVSPAILEENLGALGLPDVPTRVIPNGIDTTRFHAGRREALRARVRDELGLAEGTAALLLPGRLSAAKNPAVMVEVLAALRAEGRDVALLLAGEDRRLLAAAVPYVDALRARIDAAGLGDRVRFLGFVEEVEGPMAAADLVVLPSEYESFGLAVVEAMALGTPVLVSDRGALPWVVEEGRLGGVVGSLEPPAWIAAVAGILDDPAGTRARAGCAAEAAAARFDRDRCFAALTSLHDELAGAA